jgi:hypothetical protein
MFYDLQREQLCFLYYWSQLNPVLASVINFVH